jgi:hypothetical protein
VEAQDGRSVGGQRSVDCCGSRYFTYRNVGRRLGKVGLEGEEHNPVVSLRFNIIKCIRRSYNQGFMEYVRGFVSIKVLGKQVILVEESIQPEDEKWKLGDKAYERLQYNGKSTIIC